MKLSGVLFFFFFVAHVSGQSFLVSEKATAFEVTYQSLKLYPNPVISNAILEFKLAENAQVQVTLLNILGSQVKNLINEYRPSGKQSIQFAANQLERGTYFVRLVINGEIIKTIRVAVSPN
jgi:hypothetical protein